MTAQDYNLARVVCISASARNSVGGRTLFLMTSDVPREFNSAMCCSC